MKKQKKTFLCLSLMALFSLSGCFSPSDVLEEGLLNFNTADSSTITSSLLPIKNFENRYDYLSGTYRYFSKDGRHVFPSLSYETAFLSLTYDDECFASALDDIKNCDYYSEQVAFDFDSYSFVLNAKEENDYSLDSKSKEIRLLGLMGYSKTESTLVFLAFYYHNSILEQNYSFSDWPSFFNDNFSFFEWK
jgi:hypothetical protein